MTDLTDHDMAPCLCPACGYASDVASNLPGGGHAEPRPGDLSICLNCAALSAFRLDLSLRLLSQRELQDLPDEAKSVHAVSLAYVKERGPIDKGTRH